MFNWIKRFFTTIYPTFDAAHVAEVQLNEARRQFLICMQDAEEANLKCEYHKLQAAMYEARAKRIESYQIVEQSQ